MIKRVKDQWCVFDRSGEKSLGCYATPDEAQARLDQVERFSECDFTEIGGHRVPILNDPNASPRDLSEAYPDAPFAACWHERGGVRYWRLESATGREDDVARVIESLGGEEGEFCEDVQIAEMVMGERGENYCTVRSRNLFGGNAIEESVIVHLNEYTQWEFAKDPQQAGVEFQTYQDTLVAVEDPTTPQEPAQVYQDRRDQYTVEDAPEEKEESPEEPK